MQVVGEVQVRQFDIHWTMQDEPLGLVEYPALQPVQVTEEEHLMQFVSIRAQLS